MKPTKEYNGRSRIRMYRADCMEFMKQVDEPYDLAIVDPPYGIGFDRENVSMSAGIRKDGTQRKMDSWSSPSEKGYKDKNWDVKPDKSYFKHLFDSSENQIIWGGNYFTDILSPHGGWIVWEKGVPDGMSLSQAELAYNTTLNSIRVVKVLWAGYKKANNEDRFHPTQKPVQLYKWLLTNYAKEGDTILDTHGGSLSIAIACWDLGFDLDVCELDTDYFNDAVKRFESHIAQTQLF